MKNKITNNRGEGYIDIVVLVLCALLVIAMAIHVFPAYIAKQKVDTFATELMREAEIVGGIGYATETEESRLREALGIEPSVSWSTQGTVQLNEEMKVTVELHMDIGLFGGLGSFPVTLTGEASGKSEVYHK